MAEASRDAYQEVLKTAGYGEIATEVAAPGLFFFAEEYRQCSASGNRCAT
ncbi:hypothetical protein AB0H88_50320 [Nonomuraea sp. NPDC050680]